MSLFGQGDGGAGLLDGRAAGGNSVCVCVFVGGILCFTVLCRHLVKLVMKMPC